MSKAMYGKSMMKKKGVKKYQPGGPVTEAPVPPVPNPYTEPQPMKMVNQRVMTKSQTPSNFNKVDGGADFLKSGGAIKPTYKKGGTTKMKMGSAKKTVKKPIKKAKYGMSMKGKKSC